MNGHDVTNLASMCKLKAGRLAREVSDSCLQFWGGMGFTKENIVSQFYRYIPTYRFHVHVCISETVEISFFLSPISTNEIQTIV